MAPIRIEWKCPKCKAPANTHGKGGQETCQSPHGCMGFICDCEGDEEADHGSTFASPCPNAHCYHCGWEGTFPKKPKGLQAWEKKALEAGWTPPAARQAELGLKP